MRCGGPGTEEVRGGRGDGERAPLAGGRALGAGLRTGGGRRAQLGGECACAPLGGREGARPGTRGGAGQAGARRKGRGRARARRVLCVRARKGVR